MIRKTVAFKPMTRKPSADEAVNAWVEQGAETAAPQSAAAAAPAPAPKQATKRLSIDLPASVHREFMLYCVCHDTKAAVVVRSLLETLLKKAR